MPGFVVPAVIAGVSAISQMIAARRQRKSNMELAKFQASANERYMREQNAYNSPVSQMSRFQEAGLNPNLIYSQGNAGNQAASLSYPDIGRVDLQSAAANLMPQFSQSAMMQSQTAAIDAKTLQTRGMIELNKLQARLIAANPLLDDEGFKATIDALKGTAALKALQNKGQVIQNQVAEMSAGHQVSKIFHEVQLLEQRFNLTNPEIDQKIKAEILKSKEFQNAILEVQKKFMTDGNITPQHILQFVQMLLLKMF